MSSFKQASAANELASQKKRLIITHLRRSLICVVDHSSASSITHLRRQSLICVVDYLSASIIHLCWLLSCVDHSAAISVFIQFTWKSRSYSTQMKKSFLFNSVEKVVLIRSDAKARFHSIQMKKSFSFNLYEKSSHSIQSKKSFSFNSFEKVVLIQFR